MSEGRPYVVMYTEFDGMSIPNDVVGALVSINESQQVIGSVMQAWESSRSGKKFLMLRIYTDAIKGAVFKKYDTATVVVDTNGDAFSIDFKKAIMSLGDVIKIY